MPCVLYATLSCQKKLFEATLLKQNKSWDWKLPKDKQWEEIMFLFWLTVRLIKLRLQYINDRLLNTSSWLVNSSLTLDSFCRFCCTGFLWKDHQTLFFSDPITKRKKVWPRETRRGLCTHHHELLDCSYLVTTLFLQRNLQHKFQATGLNRCGPPSIKHLPTPMDEHPIIWFDVIG